MAQHIWLLSAYRSDSHAAWADRLTANLTGFTWHVRELPGRRFAWRIRGNPLSWLDELPGEPPDLLLATSMVDLATLRGLHPRLSGVPAVYYFHENQFAYPRSARQMPSIEPQMVQVYGALAADRLRFNSAYNRRSFFEGLTGLLERMPDHAPAGVVERLQARSDVLAVPVAAVPPANVRDERLILWNHRWEYDKDPDLFADAMLELARRGTAFRLALLGPRPARPPEPLARLRGRLSDRIVADGKLEPGEYRRILARAAIAVSTARHEFQGVGMLEAASAGARPLVPDALCYSEQYPDRYRYPPGNATALVERLTEWLGAGLPAPASVSEWTTPQLLEDWRQLLTRAADGGHASRA